MFLGKILGLYILIVGVTVLTRKKMFTEVLREYTKSKHKMMNYFAAAMVLIMGLALVLGHNIWVGGFLPVVVTIFGWLILIKGLTLLLFPESVYMPLVKWFEKGKVFNAFGVIYVVLGIYLTYLAFTL